MHVCTYVRVCIFAYVCVSILCVYIQCRYACMHTIYVRVCIYIYMCVCMCVYLYCVCTYNVGMHE